MSSKSREMSRDFANARPSASISIAWMGLKLCSMAAGFSHYATLLSSSPGCRRMCMTCRTGRRNDGAAAQRRAWKGRA